MSYPPIPILFRADASVEIGTGHLIRCATLATLLQRYGAVVTFACRDLPGNLNHWLEEQGFQVIHWQANSPNTIPADLKTYLAQAQPYWLVVDHYGLDAQWEKGLWPYVKKVLAIDDLANRPHACHALLDQNYFSQPETRYEGLIPEESHRWLGSNYALLRPEFRTVREGILRTGHREKKQFKKLQIFLGGSDPTNETGFVLNALKEMTLSDLPGLSMDVIVGASNPKRAEVQALCEAMPNTRFYCQTSRMAELMAEADLAIAAGGTATWERLCLGLPALVISVAENQEEISRQVAEAGAQVYLGRSGQVSKTRLQEAVFQFLENPESLTSLSNKAFQLVDGQGAHRVVRAMLAELDIFPTGDL
jgi:UDP-2,4-diacetamido-2,4,6-trideoxy-beta-L-altropyranose hydrolase